MTDSLRFLLVICDGFRGYHEVKGDDLMGMISLTHGVHQAGYTCWMRDTRLDELVACSTAACYCCANLPRCEYLGAPEDVDSPHGDSEAFLRDLMLKL